MQIWFSHLGFFFRKILKKKYFVIPRKGYEHRSIKTHHYIGVLLHVLYSSGHYPKMVEVQR